MEPICYGIIPARYASTRFEGKPLADIHGKPMFWHVYQRAIQAQSLKAVWLATDDTRIEEVAKALDVPCILTSPLHNSGSDRVLEAAKILDLPESSILVNIQGDEPLLEPEMLDELVLPFYKNNEVQLATLAREADYQNEKERILSPNSVKIVLSTDDTALYFSRSPIPFIRDNTNNIPYLLHIGLYAFTYKMLKYFSALPPSPLEQAEKLEQLRFLENNIPIHVVRTKYSSQGVDTLEDLEHVRKQSDSFYSSSINFA